MKRFIILSSSLILLFPLINLAGIENGGNNETGNSLPTQSLFASEEVLDLRIRGDVKALLKDRGEESTYHEFELISKDSSSHEIVHTLKIKTRGNFRKKRTNCFYPPLFLNFPKNDIPENSVFSGQNKLKLVTPCRGEKYVIREYLAYKLYNEITPYSFKARLVRVVLEDTKKGKRNDPFYAIILEDEDQMAERIKGKIKEINHVQPQATETDSFLKMAVFQYLIANTDWSTQFRQNIKLVYQGLAQNPIAVPYDFDHSGLVSAPYAKPPLALKLRSVRERRYRGYCMEGKEELLKQTLTFYKKIKRNLYRVFEESSLIDLKYRNSTLKFLDDFYKTLEEPKKRDLAFGYPCLPNGTGNVVIKGLNN